MRLPTRILFEVQVELSGSYKFDAPGPRVWTLVNDPAVIASCLPGCDQLVPIGDDRYQVELGMTVAAISGRYSGTVAIVDKQEPRSYKLIVEGSGRTGFVKGEARIEIVDETGGATLVVNGQGEVGGLLARVGQRLLGSVSKMMMDRFFACLREKAASPSP